MTFIYKIIKKAIKSINIKQQFLQFYTTNKYMSKQPKKSKYRDHSNIHPIILQMDEQQHDQNSELIKKMSKGKYSGGFKNSSVTKSKIIPDKSNLYRPSSNIDSSNLHSHINIAEQIGVSNNSAKFMASNVRPQKYRQNQSYSISQLENKVSKLRQDRNYKNGSLIYQVNPSSASNSYYNIANQSNRFQEAVHVKSSLDVISLENVEAKLEAHRRNMKPIQQEYHSRKGKAVPLDRYGYMKTNVDVDKLHSQIQNKDEEGKLYELAKKKMDYEPQEVELEQLWELKKKNNPKLAEYDAKYQEFLLQKDAKNIVGYTIRDRLFTWDKYTQPIHSKSKKKIPGKVSHSHKKNSKSPHSHQKSLSPHSANSKDLQKYGPDGLVSIRDIKDVIATKDDKFISSYIFAQLDVNKVGIVSKQQLHQYITSQEHILRGYNIDVKWLFTDLDNYETKRKGMFTKSQLALFLATLQKLQHPKLTLTSNSSFKTNISPSLQKSQSPIRSTFNKNRSIFQKLFETLDFNSDSIINRQQYIENIYIDTDCLQIIDQQVIYIQPIQRSITYREIIGYILDDYRKQKNQKLKKSKQYLTFERFCEYFQVSQGIDLRRLDQNKKKNSEKSTQSQIYDLPQQQLIVFRDIFNTLPRIYQDYVVSLDFIQTALRDPQILSLYDELCRIQSVETRLPVQTVGTCLQRMKKQCDQYSNWDTMKLFFSRRGRPLDWNYALIVKKRQLRASKLKETKRLSLSKQKLRDAEQYFDISANFSNKKKDSSSHYHDKYTIPQPFDITDMREKIPNKLAQKGEKQFQDLKKQFKANPVNQQILESKPQLIMGKILKKTKEKSQQKQYYKYENYENDRIQRALKRAQQKYDQQQALKAIKQKTKIQATNIGIDLTKKYQDVVKQQQKKQKQIQRKKFKPTQPENVSDNLYPKNPADQKSKKMDKVKKNMQKAEQIAKRKKEMLEQQKNRMKQKNLHVKKLADEAKQRQKQEKQLRDKIATDGKDFKPKIKKYNQTEEQKQANQKNRQQRERKKREQEESVIRAKQEHRKKILEQDIKVNKLDLQGLTDQEIIEKIDQADFTELLLDQEAIEEYVQQFPSKNKTRKQLKERESGLAGRQRAKMEKQQKKMMQEKRRLKQKIQKQRTSTGKKGFNDGQFSRVSQRGEKNQQELLFHKSKALRRYRAIMDGKDPLSQFDKYSVQNAQIN